MAVCGSVTVTVFCTVYAGRLECMLCTLSVWRVIFAHAFGVGYVR